MPKAKFSKNSDINPSHAYFEDFKNGMTIIDICRKYGKSRNTIVKYLKQNKDYTPPGSGYKATGKDRIITNKGKEETQEIVIVLPNSLRNALDEVGEQLTITSKVILALEKYINTPTNLRPKYKSKVGKEFKRIKPLVPTRIIKELNKIQGSKSLKCRWAIEFYINSEKKLTF